MVASPARSGWLTCLALALLPLCGCARGEPTAVRPLPNVRPIDPNTMVTAEKTVTKTFKTGATPKIVVEVFNGSITITPAADGSVQAAITKRAGAKTKAEAEEALKELAITFTEEKDAIRIAAVPPKDKPFSGGASARLEVPAGANLELKTNLNHITELATSLAPITVDAPCTAVTATNSQGRITVQGAKGPLKLTTSLGNILVNADGAELEAINSQGAIEVHGVKGRVKARTSLAKLSIEATDALVDAANAQGSVTFSGSLAAGKQLFRTSLGNIDLALPPEASFSVDAQVSQGQINNAFALKQSDKSSKTRLVGTVGDRPDAAVHVSVSQGGVTIKKRQP